MKILMTADTIGGVWQYSLELAGALAPYNVEIALATMGRRPTDAQRCDAARLPNVTLFESEFKLEWQEDPWHDVTAAGQWLLELHDQLGPEIVHLNGYAHAALPWRAPVVAVAHSCVLSWHDAVRHQRASADVWGRYERAVRGGLRAADAVVAPSQAMLNAAQRCYGEQDHAHVIYNARDPQQFRPLPKEPIVLTAGRLWDDAKNLAAIEAIAPHVAWPVHVAGEGSGANPQWVHYLGAMDAAAMAQWMGRASIYALPARYEPFGLSALEAALSGCALVLGDIESLREIWDDAAVFAPPDDHDQLAAVINELIDNPSARQELSDRARQRAMRYSPRRMAREYLRLYRMLLSPVVAAMPGEVRCAS